MTDLKINTIFQEIICNFGEQTFSAMYFGRHCGKNLLILKHDSTVMLVFGDDNQWSTAEFVKLVHFKEDPLGGVQIVGNEDVVLMLDECGGLWMLCNAFEFTDEKSKCLHSLKDNCFYEWVSFKKFNFVKVLAFTAFGHGFACLGVCKNSKKKLMVLPTMNSVLEDYTFEELNATDSRTYYLCNLNFKISNSIYKNKLGSVDEALLVSDWLSGRTYMCTKNGQCLIDQSSIVLISALQFLEKNCLALCFGNGKLIFNFYNKSHSYCVVHLPKNLVFVEKCCCDDSCLLWSDGMSLHHTKLAFEHDQPVVKLYHLRLRYAVESPLSVLRVQNYAITVTVNDIYYLIRAGQSPAVQIKKRPKELLSEISKSAAEVDSLESKTDMFSHYLYCKDIMQKNTAKEKIEIRCEGNLMVLKNSSGVCLRQKFWKVRLRASEMGKELVHTACLDCDLGERMCVTIENPFKGKGTVKVSLVGNFDGKALFFDLGTSGESEEEFENNCFSKNLLKILKKRNPFYVKE